MSAHRSKADDPPQGGNFRFWPSLCGNVFRTPMSTSNRAWRTSTRPS